MGFAQQPTPAAPELKPVPMPQDRAADSYAIYSRLLDDPVVEGKEWERSYWLVEETTTAGERPDKPCVPGAQSEMIDVNPHRAIKAPENREADFEALLKDFDLRCHERLTLKASEFHTMLPVHIADDATKDRYMTGNRGEDPLKMEFKGTAGIHSFSEVYFNPERTLAMLYQGIYCGGLCGNWKWVVLERKEGKWMPLPWVTVVTYS